MRENRGYDKKQRNHFYKQRKPLLLISAEGKNKTERYYFRKLGSSYGYLVLMAKGGSTDPVRLVYELETLWRQSDFDPAFGDKMYCVIDSDYQKEKNSEIKEADRLAEKLGAEVIVSSPCFEVWLLCHFTYSTKLYSGNHEVIRDLNRYLIGYRKNDEEVFEKTKDALETAIRNAKKQESYCNRRGMKKHTVEFMPSTEVYRIAEAIKSCGK